MQTLARKNEWPLDKVNLTVDVTKKFKEEFNQPAREGAYVYGLYMDGRQTLLPGFVGHPFCVTDPWVKYLFYLILRETKSNFKQGSPILPHFFGLPQVQGGTLKLGWSLRPV